MTSLSGTLGRGQGKKGVRAGLIEPGLVGSDTTTENHSPEERPGAIADAKMVRAEDIVVSALFMLTRPRRALIQRMVVVPRAGDA